MKIIRNIVIVLVIVGILVALGVQMLMKRIFPESQVSQTENGYYIDNFTPGFGEGETIADLNGSYTVETIIHDDFVRKYGLYIPNNLKENPEIILVLHGSGENGTSFRNKLYNDFDISADMNGFIVVYPYGFDGRWNDLRSKKTHTAKIMGIDDVGFIHRIIQDLANDYSADSDKIFAFGFSNGGQMTYRLMVQAPDMLRAAAVAGANLPVDDNYADGLQPSDTPQIPILLHFGTEDSINNYHGGEVIINKKSYGHVLSGQETVSFFVEQNGIIKEPKIHYVDDQKPDDGTSVEITVYGETDKTEIHGLIVHGGGHTISTTNSSSGFQALMEKFFQKRNQDISFPKYAIDFFLKQE